MVLDVKRRQPAKCGSLVGKVTEYDSKNPGESLREFDMLKSIKQGHIIKMLDGYVWGGCVVLTFEKLFGESVVRSLSFKNRYDEHTVTSIIKQVKIIKKYRYYFT